MLYGACDSLSMYVVRGMWPFIVHVSLLGSRPWAECVFYAIAFRQYPFGLRYYGSTEYPSRLYNSAALIIQQYQLPFCWQFNWQYRQEYRLRSGKDLCATQLILLRELQRSNGITTSILEYKIHNLEAVLQGSSPWSRIITLVPWKVLFRRTQLTITTATHFVYPQHTGEPTSEVAYRHW